MKIEFHTKSFPPKRFIGAEIYDVALIKQLKKNGHDVSVIVQGDDTWEYDGVKVLNKSTGSADIVFCHLDNTLTAFNEKRKHGSKVVGIGHNTMWASVSTAQNSLLDGLILNSETMATLIGDTKTKKKMVIIPPVPKPKKRVAVKGEKIISVNQTPAKGGVIFKNIAEELPGEEFIAILGGWGNQIEDFPQNVQVVENSKTAYSKNIKNAKAFMLASSDESWGMAASEAIANGVPVVYHSHLAGVEENIGEAGVKVAPGKFMEWVQTIEKSEFPNSQICLEQAEKNYRKHIDQLNKLDEFIEGL